jgi:PAS domain S-box-containing protein
MVHRASHHLAARRGARAHPRYDANVNVPLDASLSMRTEGDELFRLLVANVRDYAIFALDPSGRIATWNIGAERIKGYLAPEIIGRHFSVFYPREDVRAGKCEMELEVAARDGRFEDEGWRVRKDGKRFWANVVITALRDATGTLIGFAKVTRDLTERRRVEDERAARLAAEQANRTKDTFLATLGHELRNPLAPIVTALQLAKLHTDRHPVRELQVIERQVQQLRHIVDDLLDVSRIAKGKLTLQKCVVDIRDALAPAIEIAGPLMEQKGHHFDLQVPPAPLLVDGDTPRLTQVFANLICNAAKYTEPGGHITVQVSQRDHWITLEVRDDGIGIAPALLGQIFEPFVQGEDGGERQGGLGLGLPLVRSLVGLHGGEVSAHSDGAARGSVFTVRLPEVAAPPADAPRVRSTGLLPTLTRHRILVVDDNDDARMLLSDVLTELGHDVVVAGSGAEALAAAHAQPPELALLDIGLPDMDGYALAVQLRHDVPAARLVALSGYGQAAERVGDHPELDRYLVKPVELRRLIDTLAELLPDR